jgi:hypothetical protein
VQIVTGLFHLTSYVVTQLYIFRIESTMTIFLINTTDVPSPNRKLALHYFLSHLKQSFQNENNTQSIKRFAIKYYKNITLPGMKTKHDPAFNAIQGHKEKMQAGFMIMQVNSL